MTAIALGLVTLALVVQEGILAWLLSGGDVLVTGGAVTLGSVVNSVLVVVFLWARRS